MPYICNKNNSINILNQEENGKQQKSDNRV